MGLEDLASKESALVAGVTATVLSPRTRETVRRGAVFGIAGALRLGDVVAGAARGAVRGIRGDSGASTRSAPSSSRSSGSRSASRSSNGSPATRSRSTRRRSGSRSQ